MSVVKPIAFSAVDILAGQKGLDLFKSSDLVAVAQHDHGADCMGVVRFGLKCLQVARTGGQEVSKVGLNSGAGHYQVIVTGPAPNALVKQGQ